MPLAETQPCAVFSNHVVLRYSFEDARGTNFQDGSASRKNGLYKSADVNLKKEPEFTAGQFGYGVATGSKNGEIIALSVDFNKNATFFFWWKPSVSTGVQNLLNLKKDNLSLVSIKSENDFLFAETPGAGVLSQTLKQGKLQTNAWQQIGLTYDGSAKKIKLFLNGKIVGEAPCLEAALAGNLFLAGEPEFAEGVLDEFYTLDIALSEEAVRHFYDYQSSMLSESQKNDFMQAQQLRLYLPFDEKGGNEAFSYARGTGTGVLTGDAAFSDGIRLGALVLRESKDKVEITSLPKETFQGDFSLLLWVYPTDFDNKLKLVSSYSPQNEDYFMALGLDGKNLFVSVGDGKKSETLKSPVKMEEKRWYLCLLTFNQKENKVELYQDLEKTASLVMKISMPDISSFPLRVGCGLKSDAFRGKIDELKIYSKNLNEAELRQELELKSPAVKGLSPRKKLITYLTFDYDTAGSFMDHSGALHESFLKGETAGLFQDGHSGGGIRFDGKNRALVIGSSNYFNAMNDVTLSLWLKPASFGEKRKLIARHHPQNIKEFVILGEDKGNVYFGLGDGRKYQLFTGTKPLVLDAWQHVAVSYQQETSVIRMYLNGDLILEEKAKNHFGGLEGIETTLGADYGGKEAFFDGVVDELKVFSSFFGSEEIKDLMTDAPLPVMVVKQEVPAVLVPAVLVPVVEIKPPVKEEVKVEEKPVEKTVPVVTRPIPPPVLPINELSQKIFNQKSNFKGEMQQRLKAYQELPTVYKTTVKLNKIPFYKEKNLFAYFTFEDSVVKDELTSDIQCQLNPPQSQERFMPGFSGLGLYLKSGDSAIFAPLELKAPRVFSVQFSLYPVDLSSTQKMALLAFVANDKEIAGFHLLSDRLVFESPGNKSQVETRLVLMENGWQNILISYDSAKKAFFLLKNGHLLNQIPFSGTFPASFGVKFGKSEKYISEEGILDDVRFYRNAFPKDVEWPKPPVNGAMFINNPWNLTGEEFALQIFCENAADMMLSYNPDFVGGKWEPFKNQVMMKVRQEEGKQTLYCKFRNKSNLESFPVSVDYKSQGSSSKIEFVNPVQNSTIPGKR